MNANSLTVLERLVLTGIAEGRFSFFDEGFHAESSTWSDVLAEEIAGLAGISNQAAGGVISSLIKKGVVEALPWSQSETAILLTGRDIELHSELVAARALDPVPAEIAATGVVATTPRRLTTADGLSITSFRIAAPVETGGTDWFTVTATGDLAHDDFAENIHKGDQVHIEGTVATHVWEDGGETVQNREITATSLSAAVVPEALDTSTTKHLTGTGMVTVIKDWTIDDRFHARVRMPLDEFFRKNLRDYAETTPQHEPADLIRGVKLTGWWRDSRMLRAVTEVEDQINAGFARATVKVPAAESVTGAEEAFSVRRNSLEWALVDVQARQVALSARYAANSVTTVAPAPPTGMAK